MPENIMIYLLIMALTTYAIRAIPLVLLRREIKNKYVKRFLYYVPFACLTAMTVPAVFFSTGSILSAVIGFAAALVLGLFKANLPLTAVVACVAVFVSERIIAAAAP